MNDFVSRRLDRAGFMGGNMPRFDRNHRLVWAQHRTNHGQIRLRAAAAKVNFRRRCVNLRLNQITCAGADFVQTVADLLLFRFMCDSL